MKQFYLFLFYLLLSSGAFSQIDQEFWFAATDVSFTHGDRPICIRVATMADAANVTLDMPANPSFTPLSQFVSANSVFTFWLTNWITDIENSPPDQVLNKGIRLISDKQITAYYEVLGAKPDPNNPAIYSLKGKNSLGKEFYIVSQNSYPNYNYTDDFESFEIVATEDNTSITVTVTDDVVGHAAGTSFTVPLNRGQTYSVRATRKQAINTLAGSHITSDKPIAVTWSDDSIVTGGWDVVGDQTIPINLLGTEYIAIKGWALTAEHVYILATKDNTDITIDGNATPVANLNTGQFYKYVIPAGNNTAMINATKPVYVMHLSGHPGESGASILPQDYCTGSRQIGFNRTNDQLFALMILTRAGNEGAFSVNGSTTIIQAADFSAVPGSGGSWMYYRKEMAVGEVQVGQNVISNSLGKFHLGILNRLAGSSEYGYFSDFSSLFLGVDHNTCPNVSTTLDGGSGMTTYEWKRYDFTTDIWTTVGSNRYYILPDSGMYACMTNGDFCTLYDTIHVGYYAMTPVNLGPDQTSCAGQNVVLDAGAGYTQYTWSTGATTRAITVSTTNTYSVSAKDNNDCISTDAVLVSFNPLPAASLSGTTTVCSGDVAPVVSFTGTSGTEPYTFFYKVNNGPTQSVTTTSGNQVTVAQGTAVPGTFIYTLDSVSDANGCSHAQTDFATVAINPLPLATISGTSDVCSGAAAPNITFTGATGAVPYTFFYKVNSGPTQSVATTSGNSVTVSQPTGTPGTYVYTLETVTDANFCSQPQPGAATITVNPLPIPTASGPVSICEGTPGSVYATQAGMASYTWTVSPAGTITAGGTPSSASVTVTWNTALPGQFVEVNYVDLKGCTALAPYHLNVTVNATPVLTVAGNNDLCAGSANVSYSTSPGMTSYAWTISPGGTPTGSTTSSSVNVNWASNATASQSVSVAYTNSLGCAGSTLYPVTIRPLPVSSFTGSATVCQLHPDPYLYVAASGPPCSYAWSITPVSAGTIVNPAVSPASITWNNTGSANLNLYALTSFGCNASSSLPININPRPEVSIAPCFEVATNRSAKRFLLKGGRPLLTATPLQGEYLVSPTTPALTSDASGNFYFDPALVPGTNTLAFNLSYKYTSSQFGCPAISPTSVVITVRPANPPCATSMTDYRDFPPTVYRTAFAGGKCWMTENLRYGTQLSPMTASQTDNCVTEKYCLATDATCTAYGGLYQWDELIQYGVTAGPRYQGVCPGGWHIPTAADYQALIDENQGNGLAGAFLTDLSLNPRGFEALLKGMAYLNTAWAFTANNLPAGTLFWTSSQGSGNRIVTRGMNSKVQSVSYYDSSPVNAFPARCVKD